MALYVFVVPKASIKAKVPLLVAAELNVNVVVAVAAPLLETISEGLKIVP